MAINIGEVAHIQDIALFPICHVFMRAEEQDQMERTQYQRCHRDAITGT